MVELEAETEMNRTEAATFLREFADELEGIGAAPDIGDRDDAAGNVETMTVIVGDESATVVLPDRLDLDVEIGSRSGLFDDDVEQHVVLELMWEVEESPEDDTIEVT